MKIVTYNIQYSKGQDDRVDPDRIASEIQGADVMALQEVDRHWPRTGNVDQVAEIRKHFPEHYCVYGPGVDMHAETASPADPARRQFGNLVLSRYPVVFSRNHLLPKLGSIDALSVQRSSLETTLDVNGTLLRVSSLHLSHLSTADRMPQVERILALHRDARREGSPVQGDLEGKDYRDGVGNQGVADHALLLGDFNCQPDSPEYLAIVGPLSDYGGHITSEAGFVDAWTCCGGDKSAGHTSDVNDLPARLDYCFASTLLRERLKNCWVDTAATGSDHLPLWVELDI